jgi:hypothetical protein
MRERARAVAEAAFDLARVRRAKVALIERASVFGELDPPQIIRALKTLDRIESPFPDPSGPRRRCRRKSLTDWLKPSEGVLPELRKWDRYERRAAARRGGAIS